MSVDGQRYSVASQHPRHLRRGIGAHSLYSKSTLCYSTCFGLCKIDGRGEKLAVLALIARGGGRRRICYLSVHHLSVRRDHIRGFHIPDSPVAWSVCALLLLQMSVVRLFPSRRRSPVTLERLLVYLGSIPVSSIL